MSVQMVRFMTEPERATEVETALARLFAAVEGARPTGVEYAALRLGDTAEFLLLLSLAGANPLTEIPEALAFRDRLAAWAGGPVPPVPVTVLEHYAG